MKCPIQSEANLSALIESTEDLIWSVDLEHRLIAFNSAFRKHVEDTFGVLPAVGMRPRDYVPPQRVNLLPPLYDRARAEGSFRVEHLLADGRTLELAFNPIVADGETTGISVFGKDISARKAAEEEHRFLAEVVESSEDAIISYSPSGIILTWNRGAEAVFGYCAEEAVGKHGHMLAAPERRRGMEEYSADLLRGNATHQREGIGVRKDGQRIRVSITAWPIRNLAGNQTAISIIVRDVTKRMEAEEARSLLASIVESSEDAIYAVKPDGTVVSWNRSAEELSGYSSQEAIGKSVAMLAPASRQQEVRQCLETIVNGSPVSSFDTVIQRKDGCEIDVSISLSPIRNPAGAVIGACAVMHNISRRKQFERALQHAEKKYRTIYDGALEGIFQTSLEGKFLAANPALAKMLGYDSADEVIARIQDAARDLWVDPEQRSAYLGQLEESDTVRGYECQFKRKDGAIIWVTLSTRRVCSADGRALYLEGFIEDITAHKMAEMQLRDSEERYRAIFEQVEIGILHTSMEGRILRCNECFAQIIGYPRHEIPGMTFQQITAPEDLAECTGVLQRMPASAAGNATLEKRYIRKDGSLTWVKLTISMQRDAEGRALHYITVVEDINARKTAERRLAAAMEALRLSEAHYRTLFQTSVDGIAVSQMSDGKYIDVNTAFLRLVGYEREEVIGRTSKELNLWADPGDSTGDG